MRGDEHFHRRRDAAELLKACWAYKAGDGAAGNGLHVAMLPILERITSRDFHNHSTDGPRASLTGDERERQVERIVSGTIAVFESWAGTPEHKAVQLYCGLSLDCARRYVVGRALPSAEVAALVGVNERTVQRRVGTLLDDLAHRMFGPVQMRLAA